MCEYCEMDKILKSCNFCGSAKMRISVSKEMQILEVQGEKEKFSLFKRQYCPRFDIKFCPMCGRNLKNDKCVAVGEIGLDANIAIDVLILDKRTTVV